MLNNKNIFIYQIFDWREIPKEKDKNEIIHKAHTVNINHFKYSKTFNEITKNKKRW